MANNSYDIGDLVRISGAFTVASAATDPTTVTLKVKDPVNTTTSYTYALAEVTKDSTGNYHKDLSATKAGTWYYRWEGTGTCETAGESYYEVNEGNF